MVKLLNVPIRDFTKGAVGVRQVIVPPEGLEILEKIREINPEGEYVFMIDNRRIKGDRFSGKLKRICEYLDMIPRSLHKIRKTYASILLDAGCPEKLIQNQMGHTDITTTRKHYYFQRIDLPTNIETVNEVFSDLFLSPNEEPKTVIHLADKRQIRRADSAESSDNRNGDIQPSNPLFG